MNIHKAYYLFQKRFRPRRMEFFAALFKIGSNTRVLDVGGTLLNWSFLRIQPQLTILNVHLPSEELPPNVEWIVGDARAMTFEDNSFDVVFSNSVIEHVGEWEDQKRFAEEIRRVGKGYFVQTPNYYFPIEPHLMTPFIHWLPRNVGRRLVGLTVRHFLTRDLQQSLEIFGEVRLLKPKEVREMFPDAEIVYEWVLGLPKSVLAIKKK